MNKKILIIDDEKDICFLISEILKDENFNTINSTSSNDAIKQFNDEKPDLIILDVWLDGSELDGLELLKYFKSIKSEIPIIMISGHSTVDMAVQAIKIGAYDFIEKPFDTNKLIIITKRAIENSFLIKENIELKKINFKDYNLIGKSNFILSLKNSIEKIAQTTSRIMIYGSQGSGKEIVAKNIHKLSKRSEKPFIIINCSLNSNIIDDEVFGKNNFNNKITSIEKANGGTLVFDEICDLSIEIQLKILKLIQNLDSKNKSDLNIRVISTTNKNLDIEIKKGNFIRDLFNRLNVVPIKIPLLKDRSEDIMVLSEYFIKNSEFNYNRKVVFSKEAIAKMESYSWPGNIRQLKNLIDRILIMNSKEITNINIDSSNLPSDMGEINLNNSKEKLDVLSLPIKDARESFEKEYLISQINRFNGNMSKVSNFIGMERTALYRKLKSLNIVTDNQIKK